MSCRLELTETEYEIAELNMNAGNFMITLAGLELRLVRIWKERAVPHPEKITYWAEITRMI
tara:strand:+ start:1151 stop:1333 length:183 start_codon:yes stop_codon:yes gene_type:complete